MKFFEKKRGEIMPVKIITGPIGAGKTRYCFEDIERVHSESPERSCVMIVPANHTHVAEKQFADRFGGTGLNNIEVTSIEKLMREMLLETEKVIAAPGRFALIKKAIKESCIKMRECGEYSARLQRTVSSKGFIDVADSFIEDIKRYRVDPDPMMELAGKTEDSSLKQKIGAAVSIYERYNKYLEQTDYTDEDEMLIRLAGEIKNRFGDNTSVWIDKFDEFIPNQLSVIFALIDCGADITITFNTADNDAETFPGTNETIRRICEYADAKTERIKSCAGNISKSPELDFISKNWFGNGRYGGKTENAELFEAREIYTEIENAAGKIVELVREDGYRYRDISVVCGDIDMYSHLVEAVFSEYEIPYYSDARISVASHPIAVQILSVFDVIRNNFDHSSMADYMRAGFLYTKDNRRIREEDIDRLENYVLKYGLRGKTIWLDPEREWGNREQFAERAFKGIRAEREAEAETKKTGAGYTIDELRRIFTAPIEVFMKCAEKAKTVRDYCEAVYELICALNLYSGIEKERAALEHNNATADSQRFSQIWNMVLNVLDQLYLTMGEDEVSFDDFEEYLLTAMSKCEIKTVPSGIDRVYIGTSERDIDGDVKVMFMLGAVTNTYPKISASEGFFSDADRAAMKDNDIVFAPSTDAVARRKHNVVYKLINKPSDRLYISYPVQNIQGKPQRPSQLFLRVHEMLPGIRVRNDISMSNKRQKMADDEKRMIKRMYLSSPRVTLHRLWQTGKSGESRIYGFVEEWFENSEEWKQSYDLIKNTKKYFENGRDIQKINIPDKDGEREYDYTSVNTYIKCPFSYYMKYILKAYERREWKFDAADTGTYAHELIRCFCEELDKKDLWQKVYDELNDDSIEEKTADRLLDEIADKTVDNIKGSDFKDKEKVINIVNRIRKTVKNVAAVTVESVKSGQFSAFDYEHDFRVKLADNLVLRGKIDRIDVCSHDDIDEFRVIDYKTGREVFSESKLDSGIDMQLFIYAIALLLEAEQSREKLRLKDGEKADISGVYYSHVHNRIADSTANTSVEKQIRSNTSLDGMTFVDTENVTVKVNRKDTEKQAATEDSVKRIASHLKIDEKGNVMPTPFFEFKDGRVLAEKRICDRSVGKYIMGRVKEKLVETDRAIRDGNIEMKPYKPAKSSSTCDHCPYSAVCSFDEQFKHEWEIEKNDTDARGEFEEGGRKLKDEMDK